MTMGSAPGATPDAACWSPNFVDYLFLAYNTSTAYSPTDAPVLACWAKALMMLQSHISLTVLALLAARRQHPLAASRVVFDGSSLTPWPAPCRSPRAADQASAPTSRARRAGLD